MENNITYTPEIDWLLMMADSSLIMAQRNSEWCGHGPVLEQDIALSNIALDELGQARNFYQYAAKLYNAGLRESDVSITEDDWAFLRDTREYKNVLLSELPNGDWAQTITRLFFFSHYQYHLVYNHAVHSDRNILSICMKASKELTYHVRWSSEWMIRLGDGTDESKSRVLTALENLSPFLSELFIPSDYEKKLHFYDLNDIRMKFIHSVNEVFKKAHIHYNVESYVMTPAQKGGKHGLHSEYLGYILAEMQFMQRAYPNMQW